MRIVEVMREVLQLDGHAFIAELYRELLCREPDPGGHQHHVDLLAAGMPKLEMVARLLRSPESMERNGFEELPPPTELYRSTLDWVDTLHLPPSGINASYKSFDCGQEGLRSQPKGEDVSFKWKFEMTRQTSMPPPQFVAVIPGGRVIGEKGAVISPDNKLLWDVSIDFDKGGFDHSIFSEIRTPPVRYTSETVAVLTSSASYNYYHWTFDVLTRIELLRRTGIPIDKYAISRRGGDFSFQDETLAIMGIPKEKLIKCDARTHLRAETLVVPSMAGYTGHMPKQLCQALRERIVLDRGLQPVNEFKRIFISRSRAPRRKMLNEPDVFRLLQNYGFRSVELEGLTVTEQARIFLSAEIIVSPHGAGLANLVYCTPGTKLLEIFSPKYVHPCYWILSEQAGLDYYYLMGDGESSIHNFGNEDIVVNMRGLSGTLAMMGLH
ncbi:glycosyltransferase 61 family protein [Paenibacillus sp. HJGM_3]|uniref:glycosyltransferase 61 family protein n=1 Tax=Paenibacillus sp. HJGM_3 TaxID=3379816 RepID=UPI00385E2531